MRLGFRERACAAQNNVGATVPIMYYERNLPHWHPPAKDIFVSWRLHDTLPLRVIKQLGGKSGLPDGKRFLLFDRELDRAAFGPFWLAAPEIAEIVVNTLQAAEQRELCKLHAFVVMPNHVHVLIEPWRELRRITKWIKGTSAVQINRALNKTGQRLWQDESFDHWIRNSAQFERVRAYIENNPVKAGLARSATEWPWSSATCRWHRFNPCA